MIPTRRPATARPANPVTPQVIEPRMVPATTCSRNVWKPSDEGIDRNRVYSGGCSAPGKTPVLRNAHDHGSTNHRPSAIALACVW